MYGYAVDGARVDSSLSDRLLRLPMHSYLRLYTVGSVTTHTLRLSSNS